MEHLPAGPIQHLLRTRYSAFHAERCDCRSPLRPGFGGRPHLAGSGWSVFSELVLDQDRSFCSKVLERPTISLWSADRIATKLGTHLIFLYPELYADELEVAS